MEAVCTSLHVTIVVCSLQVLQCVLPKLAEHVEDHRRLTSQMLHKFKLKSFKPQNLTVSDLDAATLATFFLMHHYVFVDDIAEYTANSAIIASVSGTAGTATAETSASTPPSPPSHPLATQPHTFVRNPAEPKCRKHNPTGHHAAQRKVTGHPNVPPLPPPNVPPLCPPNAPPLSSPKRKRKRKKPKPQYKQVNQAQPYKPSTFTLLPLPDMQLCHVKLTNTTLKEVSDLCALW